MKQKVTAEDICNEIHQKIDGAEKVLDVGCGDGHLVNCLASKLKAKVIGFDVSDKGFLKSHEKCKQFNTCNLIECREGDAHKIDKYFKNTKFDIVTMVYSLHHFGKPVQVLNNVSKIMNENSKLVVADYWFTKRKKKRNCYRFLPEDIKQLMLSSGFRYLGEDRIAKDFTIILGEKVSK